MGHSQPSRQMAAESRLSPWMARLAGACTIGALGLGILYLAFFLYHAAATIAFPYDLDWGEGYVLNDALRLWRGEPIYVDLQQFPMVRSPYPPLFLLADGLLMALLGPGFLAGRLLSTVATLGAAALVARIARLHGATRLAAVLGGLLLLSSPHVYQWAPYSRVDMLAVALSLLALLLASGSASPGRLALAGLAGMAALLTKQTAIAVPLGIALSLALTRPRMLAPLLGALLVPGMVVVLWLTLASEGQFIRHVVLGNAGNPTNLARLVVFQVQFSVLHPIALAAAAGYILVAFRRRKPDPLVCATGCSWLVSLSVANETSSVNYFLELVALAAAAAAASWTPAVARSFGLAFLAPAFALVQFALLFHVPNLVGVWPSFFAPHGYTPTAGDYEVGREIDRVVAATAGPIISEPAGFALRNGKEVLLQPLDLRAEQLRGRWDSAPLRLAIRERRFGLIVLSYGLFPDDVKREIQQAYRLERTLVSPNGMRYELYRPRA